MKEIIAIVGIFCACLQICTAQTPDTPPPTAPESVITAVIKLPAGARPSMPLQSFAIASANGKIWCVVAHTKGPEASALAFYRFDADLRLEDTFSPEIPMGKYAHPQGFFALSDGSLALAVDDGKKKTIYRFDGKNLNPIFETERSGTPSNIVQSGGQILLTLEKSDCAKIMRLDSDGRVTASHGEKNASDEDSVGFSHAFQMKNGNIAAWLAKTGLPENLKGKKLCASGAIFSQVSKGSIRVFTPDLKLLYQSETIPGWCAGLTETEGGFTVLTNNAGLVDITGTEIARSRYVPPGTQLQLLEKTKVPFASTLESRLFANDTEGRLFFRIFIGKPPIQYLAWTKETPPTLRELPIGIKSGYMPSGFLLSNGFLYALLSPVDIRSTEETKLIKAKLPQ